MCGLGARRCMTLCLLQLAARRLLEGFAVMVNFAQALRDHWVHILVPLGFVIGCYLDRWNDEKLSTFRNKSLLYRRELKPGEEVTWK
ncbi:NADH dehydrogenase [ubiquinone] 1 beta subcomplex subunit 1 isoform 1-T1 [Leptosomus discolor]